METAFLSLARLFADMTNIKNEVFFRDSMWDWTPFNKCFRYGIRISDIDGVVERNGKCLYIETKSPGTPIPIGQQKLHQQWLRKGDTVLIVWGQPNSPESALLMHSDKWKKRYDNCDNELLERIVKEWFEYADKRIKDDE